MLSCVCALVSPLRRFRLICALEDALGSDFQMEEVSSKPLLSLPLGEAVGGPPDTWS